MNKSAHPRSRCGHSSSLERVHVQIPRPGPRSRPQRHPAPRRHQSWRSRVQQDSVSTLVSAGQRARRQTRRRNSPLRDRTLDEGPIIEQDVVRVDHRHSVDDLAGLGRADLERGVLSRVVLWHCEDRSIRYGNKPSSSNPGRSLRIDPEFAPIAYRLGFGTGDMAVSRVDVGGRQLCAPGANPGGNRVGRMRPG